MTTNIDLRSHIKQAAFAFRGYNVTNLGRSPALLAHPAYGPIVEAHLRTASEICSDTIKRPIDLVARVQAGRESVGLNDYAEDVALIAAMEMAQIRLLDEFFGVTLPQARLAFGYSLGECATLMATGVYKFEDFLHVPLAMADDCAALANDVTLAILFSRGPVLDFDTVHRLCLEISQGGEGVIDVSTYLSPNSLLLMGQNGTLIDFEKRIHDLFPKQVHVRRHQHRYPPLHTPIVWQRNITNRAAVLLQKVPGGLCKPSVPVLSGHGLGELQRLQQPGADESMGRSSATAMGRDVQGVGRRHRDGSACRTGAESFAGDIQSVEQQPVGADSRP
jgi:[acyl-carrier-protein] S-malonyltransferase